MYFISFSSVYFEFFFILRIDEHKLRTPKRPLQQPFFEIDKNEEIFINFKRKMLSLKI